MNSKQKLEELLTELKRLVRNLGKSNMIHKDEIEEIIVKYERQTRK